MVRMGKLLRLYVYMQILEDNQRFSFSDHNNFTLTHLACAVGAKDVVTRLSQDGRVFNSKDHDGKMID